MLLAGTYERFLFGFQLHLSDHKQAEQSRLVRTCTYAAHQNAVKCVAAGGYFVASGGADDQIHLYDIKHNKDLGFLMNPGDGAVPCIQFYCPPDAHGAPSHMFSGSADGSIAVWQAGGQWQHLKLMKGHKASVNSLTIHPTGRLAMSVAHDCSLRMWDLARGVSEFNTQLPHEADTVAFTPSGDEYVLVAGNKVTVHSAGGEGEVVAKLEHKRRVCSLAIMNDTTLIAGLEDGAVKVWDTRTSSVQLSQERAHATRIRGLALVPPSLEAKTHHHLCSASSDGVIKLWDIRTLGSGQGTLSGPIQCLEETGTKARITCLAIANPQAPKPKALPTPAPKPTLAAAAAAAAAPAGKAKPAAAVGKAGKGTQPAAPAGTASKAAKGSAPKQNGVSTAGTKRGGGHPGFEIVSEAQQAKKQKQRQALTGYESDDDHDDHSAGAAGAAPHTQAAGQSKTKVQAKPQPQQQQQQGPKAAGGSGNKKKGGQHGSPAQHGTGHAQQRPGSAGKHGGQGKQANGYKHKKGKHKAAE